MGGLFRKLITLSTTGLMAQVAWGSGPAVEMNGNIDVSGTVTANSFSGSGAGLTNLPVTCQLPQNCQIGQVLKWNGSTWYCGNDSDSGMTPANIHGYSGINAGGMGNDVYIGIASGGVASDMLAAKSVNASHIAFYSKVAIVAPSGGNFADPVAAMSSSNYGQWCGIPSATNPCLVKIMPGVYNIGTNSVTMQPYIDIEGSGENMTVIQGSVDSPSAGVVMGSDNAELRFLTVNNSGNGHTNAIGIYNQNIYGSAKFANITVSVPSATNCYGVYNNGSSPLLNNVTVNAWGGSGRNYGIYNSGSTPYISNSTINGSPGTGGGLSYGVYNAGSSSPKIDHSNVSGTTSSLYNNSGGTFSVAYSRLGGGAVAANGGTFRCVGAYNINYVALGTSCQ